MGGPISPDAATAPVAAPEMAPGPAALPSPSQAPDPYTGMKATAEKLGLGLMNIGVQLQSSTNPSELKELGQAAQGVATAFSLVCSATPPGEAPAGTPERLAADAERQQAQQEQQAAEAEAARQHEALTAEDDHDRAQEQALLDAALTPEPQPSSSEAPS